MNYQAEEVKAQTLSVEQNSEYIPPEFVHETLAKWLINNTPKQNEITTCSDAMLFHDVVSMENFPFEIVGPENESSDYSLVEVNRVEDACFTPPLTLRGMKTGRLTFTVGAFDYKLRSNKTSNEFYVRVAGAFLSDDLYQSPMMCLMSAPNDVMSAWFWLELQAEKMVKTVSPDEESIHVIGGWVSQISADVDWGDIVLPSDLKKDIMSEVNDFFQKGVDVYKELGLNPFRKIMFAGVPGTGKTMLANALCRWAIEKNYFVIYVSGSDKYGASFGKVQDALMIAEQNERKTVIVVEEIDAYLQNPQEQARMLNILDGSETPKFNEGVLMITTTNHPDAIEDRIKKRPGRIDKVFIIPEVWDLEVAEAITRRYLKSKYTEELLPVVKRFVDKPGSFVREVCIFALIQMMSKDMDEISLSLLQDSYEYLHAQIEAKDTFVQKKEKPMGFGEQVERVGSIDYSRRRKKLRDM